MKHFGLTCAKILAGVFFLLCSLAASAQKSIITKYYDSNWVPVPKENAVYYTEFEKKDKFYSCTSYFAGSKKLKSTATSTDTLFSEQVGLLLRYYESGVLEDSVLVSANRNETETYHYYPSGKLWCYSTYNKKTKNRTSNGYDETCAEIAGFITEREAEYPGGAEEWREYLSKWIDMNVPTYNHAPKGVYQVIVKFMIDEKGKVTNVEAETAFGFGMEAELLRTIKKSKKWIPAIQYNLPVKAYRRQPLRFVIR